MKGSTLNYKKILVLFSIFLLIGCGHTLSEKAAKEAVVKKLSKKYGGAFTVTDVENFADRTGPFALFYYRLSVCSEELGDTVLVYIQTDGRNMHDNFEELLYKDKVMSEINSVQTDCDGWRLDKCSPCFQWGLDTQKRSRSFTAYKSDPEKITLDVHAHVYGTKASASSLFRYIDAMQKLDYKVNLTIEGIRYNDIPHNSCYMNGTENALTEKDIVNAVSKIYPSFTYGSTNPRLKSQACGSGSSELAKQASDGSLVE